MDNPTVPRRLAWFSPMPPARSGIAAVNAELVPHLRAWYDIDVFVDDSAPGRRVAAADVGRRPRSAHDFVWLNQQAPYDLTVFQLGNSSVHEYMWPYLFRYPGLTVLHDARLHHARAAALLRAGKQQDYRAEFAASTPEASPDLAELAVNGFDSHLYYYWPMTRLVVARSRLTAVHAGREAERLREEAPDGRIEPIRLGHGSAMPADDEVRRSVRARYRIPQDAVVFGCFGGLSPEKRVPRILAAFAATRAYHPGIHLLLAGAVPGHYDLQADIDRSGIRGSTILTGYLESDDDLGAHISACDVALNLRWPTAREISGPWLRCLAAGVPTVITQLSHLAHVPSLDPRTWRLWTGVVDDGDEAEARADAALRPSPPAVRPAELETGNWKLETGNWRLGPVCVAIDILDEDHSLQLAMRRLARDGPLRRALGEAARKWWEAHHAPERMVEDYRRIIPLAMEQPLRGEPLPSHLVDAGGSTLERVLAPFGLPNPLR
ncbi:MAG TPA: glycosyltransferase [Gemmatimonadaceae bacterium]